MDFSMRRGWTRFWQRLRRTVRLLVTSRDLRVTWLVLKHHAGAPVQEFIARGGKITGTSATAHGRSIALRPTAWWGLPSYERFVGAGGSIQRSNGGDYRLKLTNGLCFVASSENLPDVLGVLVERFVDEEYAPLEVSQAIVIDIGSHIGDSAAYFLQRGAQKVYCFEPFSELMEAARENLRMNGFLEQVILNNIGIGFAAETLTTNFDSRQRAINTTDLPFSVDAVGAPVEVRLESFVTVLQRVKRAHPNDKIICKMDCEGCESNAFAHPAGIHALVAVDQFAIEFHSRVPSGFVAQLKSLGFSRVHQETKHGAELLFAWKPTLATV